MEYQVSKSTCNLCNKAFTGRGMGKHIKSCLPKYMEIHKPSSDQKSIHLHVKYVHNPDYFLHILVQDTTTLGTLDQFFRDIWLECCGHLSEFAFDYPNDPLDMGYTLGEVYRPGSEMYYQYDFGSTTELTISFLDVYDKSNFENQIELLARNAQPLVPCDECGKNPAVQICCECEREHKGWLCQKCLDKHSCGGDNYLPVVNSPRVGVCGYTGLD